jgi:Flp pilus assembly protein TadG
MRRRRPEGRRRGTAAVEMALVLPLFLALVLGMIEMARLGMVAQLITDAAREGCRVAVLPGSDPTAVTARITSVLAGSGIGPTVVITPLISATNPPGGAQIQVQVSVPYSAVAWFSPIQYLGSTTVQASVTMSSERP